MYTSLGAVTAEEFALLPDCYSKAFDDCIVGDQPTNFPNCKQIWDVYDRSDDDYDTMDAAVNALPSCSAADCCAVWKCKEGCPSVESGSAAGTAITWEDKLLWGGIGAVGGIIVAGLVSVLIT